MNLDISFTLDTKEGPIECEVLTTIYSEKYKKNYLIYTDNITDEEGNINYFISSFDVEKDDTELNDVFDETELNDISNQFEAEYNETE